MALRLYPTLISGLPFSTDAWSPIKNAEVLMEQTPINIGDNEVFDGYNNYWPANSLFGAVASLVTSLSPMEAMAFFLPVTGAITVLIFYTLTRNLFNDKISLMPSIIFGTAFTHAFFTAGVTKETYANPLYLSLILIFLNKKLCGKGSATLTFAIISVALALAHHLTSIIAIAILFAVTLARLINNVKSGMALNKFDIQLTSILIITVILYFGLYAHKGFAFPITSSDMLSAGSYQVIMFTLAAYITFKPYISTKTKTLISTLGTAILAFLFVVITINTTLVPSFTPTVQKHVLPYVSPYFIIMPFITLGYGYQRRIKGSMAPVFWLAALMGLQAYSIFSSPAQNVGLLIRTPNFLYPPIAVLSAAGMQRICKIKTKPSLQMLSKLIVIATISAITIINIYSLYAAVNLEDMYMGYQWLYRIQEYRAGAWIVEGNVTEVAGDMKVYHLLKDYFRLKVDVIQGYQYLSGKTQSQPNFLFVYGQMFRNGYVLTLHGVNLPGNWMEKTSCLNYIYSNGLVNLYAG